MASRLLAEDRLARTLPDGGYVCNFAACDAARYLHNHCACGLPRRPTAKVCFLCKAEHLTRAGRRTTRISIATTLEFLMGYARALDPSRDR